MAANLLKLLCLVLLVGRSEARADYQADTGSDTLAQDAASLERGGHYAHAMETWQRVVAAREADLDAAKAMARGATGKRLAAAKAAAARARKQADAAAEAIIKLWPNVGRIALRVPAGVTVTRDGVAIDPKRPVLVNAGHDELAFEYASGSTQHLIVEVQPGAVDKLDAPVEPRKPIVVEVPMIETPVAVVATRYLDAPRSRTLSRVGLGVTAGAVVVGGLAGGLAYLADRDYDRAGCSADGRCQLGPANDLAERSNDRARLARIGAIGAGALLATGVTIYIVGRGKTRHAATDVTLRVAPASTTFAWRF